MVQYPGDYFEDEYRDGFLVERTMKCAWAAQLEVLRHISDVCEKHGLKYFAFFGTLLGAIRHHGFIPWDDDVDIVMMRADYQRFLEVCKAELPSEYCVLNCYDYPEWPEVNIRITNGDYIDISPKRMREYYGCPFSVGVDVYPLDTIPDDPEIFKQEMEILNLIANTNSALTNLENAPDGGEQNQWREQTLDGLRTIGQVLEYEFDFNGNLHSQLIQLFDQMCQVFSQEEGISVTTMAAFVKGATKMTFDKLWLRDQTEFPFEYESIKVPIGYEACLWKRFGENYMTPMQIKASHEYPFYKRQKEILCEKGIWQNIDELSKDILTQLFKEPCGRTASSEISDFASSGNKKKKICYRVSLKEFLSHDADKVFEKIRSSIKIIRENQIDAYFVPDEEIFYCARDSKISEGYRELLDELERENCLARIQKGKEESFVSGMDAYYGDVNSWIYYFKKYKKPIMVESVDVTNS